MAITVRTPATANNGAGATTTLSVGYPAGSSAGDLILQVVNAQGSSGSTTSANGAAGLTNIDSQQGVNNTAKLWAWQTGITEADIAGTTPGFTLSIGLLMAGIVLGMSGAVYESIADGAQVNATSCTAPSVTPSTDGCLLVLMVATVFSTANTAFTVSTPAGWSTAGSTHTTNATSRTGLDFFSKQLGAATGGVATGTTTVSSGGGVTLRWITAIAVIRPSSPDLVMASSIAGA